MWTILYYELLQPVVISATPASSSFSSLTIVTIAPQSPNVTTTFSAPQNVLTTVLLALPANVTYSSFTKAAIASQSPAGSTTYSSVATTVAISTSSNSTTTFSGISTAAWTANTPSANTTYSSLTKVSFSPTAPSARTTFDGLGNLGGPLSITTPVGFFTASAPAITLILTLGPTAGLVTYSNPTKVAFALTGRGNVTYSSATPKVALTALPGSATTTFSGIATVITPIAIQGIPGSTIFSGGTNRLVESVTTPIATVTYVSTTLTGSLALPAGSATLTLGAIASVTQSPNPTTSTCTFNVGTYRLSEVLQGLPGSTTFSGIVRVVVDIPGIVQIVLLNNSCIIELMVNSVFITLVSNTVAIRIEKASVGIEVIGTGADLTYA